MSKVIKIGTVQIREEDYAIQANAILGIRGTGKTTLAKSIAEQMLDAHIPIIVFDPTGVWRYLKRGAKKGTRGYPIVVAGGVEPDLQLTPSTAAEIVRAAIKEEISLVIDLYDRKLSKSDWRRIVRDCFRTLMYENEGVRHIFLEEAAEFAPQRVQDGETYSEVEKVVRMGGNASLGITLINQRSQEVNKAVLELCENLILMKQRGSHAITALEKWIDKVAPDQAKRITEGMPQMAAGVAWVFRGDDAHAKITKSNTLHTFHPDRRHPEAIKRAGKAPDVDKFVSRLGARLKDKASLDTIESLRAQVKAMTKDQGKVFHSKRPVIADIVTKTELKVANEFAARWEKRSKTLEQQITRMKQAFNRAGLVILDDLPSLPDLMRSVGGGKPKVTGTTMKSEAARVLVPKLKEEWRAENFNGPELTGPQRALLKSLYWLRDEPITLAKAAFYAGYKPGRYSSDRIGELRTVGLVLPKTFLLSAEGRNLIAGTAGEKPTGRQLHQTVRNMLTGPQNKILDALLESAGPLSLAEISEATGYEVGRYLSDRVGELRTLELVLGNDKTGGAQPSPFFRE